ncbi:MAG: FG-GAP-like repeat-containing protein [Candidatus Omnitrophica bacterium]|nr:FG-GAP-like repeat-containing protein [Candidatus Omnitrophota bacterium]
MSSSSDSSIVFPPTPFQASNFNHVLDSVSPDIFTGRAQLSIPISIPRGKRDISPQLTIAYQSGNGTGVVGVGWSLDLGSIARSTKKGVPKYDSSDIFIAQGQELTSIGNSEYRSQIEGSFVKYVFDGTTWLAVDKTGTKYYFGSTDASHVTISKGTYSWALDKIMDLKGNYLTVTYDKNGNELYPSNISYTANDSTGLPAEYHITFTYENRLDTSTTYIIGDLVQLLRRLTKIEISFGSNLIHKYVFEYIQSPSTQRSLLNKITEYGADGTTASPPIIFTYRTNTGSWSTDQQKWHAPDGDFITSGMDQGRRLYDLNGDGMADFVVACHDWTLASNRQQLIETFLGSKNGFSATSNWLTVPGGYFTFYNRSMGGTGYWDNGRRLVDLTGDGIPELLVASPQEWVKGGPYKDTYEFKYPTNLNPQWSESTNWNLPEGYFVYRNVVDDPNNPNPPPFPIGWGILIIYQFDGGIRFADLNGDGLNDLSIALDTQRSVPRDVNTYINTGSGWQQDTRWNIPDGNYYSTGSGDGGVRLVDVNGDGLADVLIARDGNKATYLNNGSGWTRNDAYNIPDGDFCDGGRDQGRMLVDINGDGLPDLVIAQNGYHAVYINTGSGWKRDDSFNLPDGDFVDANGSDQGRYLGDLDGDGVIDSLVAKDGYKKAYLNLTGVPDFLIGVSNGLGGSTNIEYTPSTAYNNYGANQTGRLPFAVQAVSRITSNDGQGNSYVTAYSYSGGYYYAPDRDYRGFNYVKVTDATGNYKESYFKQDDILKGKPYEQDTSDSSGKLLAKTVNVWQATQLYQGVNFPFLAKTDSFIYDGSSYKQTETQYQYDNYGNTTTVTSCGDMSLTGDEKSQVTEFVYDVSDWIVALPKHASLLDAQGNKVSEKWFYYDYHANVDDLPTLGLLTKEENLLYNPLTIQSARVSTQYTYDQYGNPLSVTDALGRQVTTMYDTVCYSYPVNLANALTQNVATVYYGINEPNNDSVSGFGLVGQVKSVQDVNNQKTYNVYDALGRLVKVIGPNDTEVSPGIVYEYNLTLSPVKVTKRVKINYDAPLQYLSSFQFSDGLSRIVEVKSPAQSDIQGQARQVVSGLVKYDSRGQVKEKYLPYFVSASEDFEIPAYDTPHNSYDYDALGRLIKSTNPDLSYSTISYSLWKRTATDENGHSITGYSDAYGRVIKVQEQNNTQIYNTNYQYDTLGNLTQVTDNKNNITQMWYDSLGRKLKMNDPDMGICLYAYDDVGNLVQQTDAKIQVLSFNYDSLNRLTTKLVNGQTIVTYSYDDSSKTYCMGRLSNVSDQSGSTGFYYDNLGREIKSVKTVDGASYAVERTYDALGRIVTLKYPDNSMVQYSYNPQGLSRVTDLTSSADYVSNIDYSATGQITRIQYGNGTEIDYAYDPNTLRLSNLITQSPFGKVQDLSYQFDKIGNIRQLSDYVNTATQSFSYDDLSRLIQASGSYGTFSYTYDSIGNMLSKEGVNLTYGKNGVLPHAVTRYGSTAIDYDANGNMIAKGNLQLTYDAENRLIKAETKPNGQQTASVNLTLNPGWNFFSFPVVPANTAASSVLSSITGKFVQVSRYNPSTKNFEHYVGNSKYDQFSTFEYGRGYQIFISSSSPVTLSVTGTLPLSQSLTLNSGVNLIFAPSNTELPVENALSGLKLGIHYSKVLFYDTAQGVFQEYSGVKKDFTTLKPGAAYYLYCLTSSTWTITNSSLSSDTTTFVYDGDGERVKKTNTSGSTTYIGSLFEKDYSGKTTKYIFAGANRICTVDSTGEKSFYHSDHLGSSNVITDSTGRQTGLTEFTPYGSVSKQTGSHGPKYKFTGKELDNTGLYFYGARYYDPTIGRFITADTIVQSPYDPQALNRYSYCRNNPINYTDPTGHSWWKKFWGKVSGFLGAAVGVALGFINPFLGMFAYSAISASGQGGNFGQNLGINFASSLAGFVVGTAASGIASNIFGGTFWPGLAGAALGGSAGGAATSAMLGGNVGMGALSGLAGGTIGYIGGFVWPLGGDAVAGGVSSVVMGGDFGEGAAQGAYYNMADTVGGILGPMPTLGEQDPQPGDIAFLKANSSPGWGISLFEGGPFSHVGTVTDKGLASTNFGEDSGYVDLGKYSNRGAYVSTRYRGNQSVINAAMALSNQSPKIRYGFFFGQKVCSTITVSALNKGDRGWWGIGPNSQFNVMKTYGEE